MSSDHTSIDVEAMKKTARLIGQLMDDMTVFDELKGHQPVAGDFDAGRWLTAIVSDRQNGLLQHATDLKNAFSNMASRLQTIAEDFAGTDTSNADGVKKFEREARADLGDMIAQQPGGPMATDQVSLSGSTPGQPTILPAGYAPTQQSVPDGYAQQGYYPTQQYPAQGYAPTEQYPSQPAAQGYYPTQPYPDQPAAQGYYPTQQATPVSYDYGQPATPRYEAIPAAAPDSGGSSFDSGDNTNPGGAHETIRYDSDGSGSTVTLPNGSTTHVEGGEP